MSSRNLCRVSYSVTEYIKSSTSPDKIIKIADDEAKDKGRNLTVAIPGKLKLALPSKPLPSWERRTSTQYFSRKRQILTQHLFPRWERRAPARHLLLGTSGSDPVSTQRKHQTQTQHLFPWERPSPSSASSLPFPAGLEPGAPR